MTLTERTQVLLRRAALAEMPATYRSLVLALARTDGLESGELVRLSPRWWNIGRWRQEVDAEHDRMRPAMRAMLAHRDEDDFVVTPRDSLLEREAAWGKPSHIEELARRIASHA